MYIYIYIHIYIYIYTRIHTCTCICLKNKCNNLMACSCRVGYALQTCKRLRQFSLKLLCTGHQLALAAAKIFLQRYECT